MSQPPPILRPPPPVGQSPLRLSVFKDALFIFTRDPLTWMVHALPSTVLLTLASYQVTIVLSAFAKSMDVGPEQISGFIFAFALNLAGMWMVFFTGSAICPALRKGAARKSIELKDIFGFQGRVLQALEVSLAMTVLITLGYCSCYFPGLFAEGATMTAHLRAVDRRENFASAFRESAKRLGVQVFTAGVSVHVLLLILLVAGCVPFVGYLVGVPLYNISRALFYLRLSAQEQGQSL